MSMGFYFCFHFILFCMNFKFPYFPHTNSGYAPRYSSVEDPSYSIHGSLGYDPNLDNSVFEDQPQLGAPRAIFDEDERLQQQQPRERSPDKMNFGGSQRGWLCVVLRKFEYICIHLRISAYICVYLPTLAYICLHLRTFSYPCVHLRAFVFICKHLRISV
jgi:hypothetical protein